MQDRSSEHMPDRIAVLERRLARQQRLLVGIGVLAVAAVTSAFTASAPGVLRARGLVIVDDAGRERILIGAPIPAARNRVRTDRDRVAALWARRFPDSAKYMGWYANYRHTMHGMLVLDENGFDRVVVGDSVPDPNIGRRIGPAAGIEVNDRQGFERTGYGLLDVNGKTRVVLGLDSDQGTEALTLSVDETGKAGVRVDGPGERSAFLGFATQTTRAGTDTVRGLVLRRAGKTEHRLDTDGPR